MGNIVLETTCARCGSVLPLGDVSFLPEMEKYLVRLTLYRLGKGPQPEKLDTKKIRKKYGFDYDCLFCEHCLATLLYQEQN